MSLNAHFSCQSDYDPDALSVDQARGFIRSQLTPLHSRERVALRSALGRILASDVIAPFNVPAHDNSAMDGYALRHADLSSSGETSLRVIATMLAGQVFAGSVSAGQCVRIMTGALPPAGCDTVVIQEVVRVDGDLVVIPAGQRVGQNIRLAGEDLAVGKPALAAGRLIRPAELGLMASLGCVEVSVYRRLRVAFFSTGDELCSLGTPLAEGEVYDSNRYTIFGMLTRLGVDVVDMGVVRDDPESHTPRVRIEADRGVFAFDMFGRLRQDSFGQPAPSSDLRVELTDRDARGRPLRVAMELSRARLAAASAWLVFMWIPGLVVG